MDGHALSMQRCLTYFCEEDWDFCPKFWFDGPGHFSSWIIDSTESQSNYATHRQAPLFLLGKVSVASILSPSRWLISVSWLVVFSCLSALRFSVGFLVVADSVSVSVELVQFSRFELTLGEGSSEKVWEERWRGVVRVSVTSDTAEREQVIKH